jgi:hypothetical protein
VGQEAPLELLAQAEAQEALGLLVLADHQEHLVQAALLAQAEALDLVEINIEQLQKLHLL